MLRHCATTMPIPFFAKWQGFRTGHQHKHEVQRRHRMLSTVARGHMVLSTVGVIIARVQSLRDTGGAWLAHTSCDCGQGKNAMQCDE